jgi:hypothetical protein
MITKYLHFKLSVDYIRVSNGKGRLNMHRKEETVSIIEIDRSSEVERG